MPFDEEVEWRVNKDKKTLEIRINDGETEKVIVFEHHSSYLTQVLHIDISINDTRTVAMRIPTHLKNSII